MDAPRLADRAAFVRLTRDLGSARARRLAKPELIRQGQADECGAIP